MGGLMEKWDGIERRRDQRSLGFCPAHIELVSDLAVIKTSLTNIEKTITESATFKTSMIFALLGIILTVVIQIVIFANLYGGLSKQVEINTARWTQHDVSNEKLLAQIEQLRIEVRNPQIYKER